MAADGPADVSPASAGRVSKGEWIRLLDGRIHRIGPLTVIVYVIYLYYGLIAPLQASGRARLLEHASLDLERITEKFVALRASYATFVGQPNGLSDIRFLRDGALDSSGGSGQQLGADVSAPDESQVAELRRTLKDLVALYQEHYNVHSRHTYSTADDDALNARLAIVDPFRHAVASLLEGPGNIKQRTTAGPNDDQAALGQLEELLLVGGNPHVFPSDPVNQLDSLVRLESAIRVLKDFEGSAPNSQIVDAARSKDGRMSELGDSVTRTLAVYSNFKDYNPLQDGDLRLSRRADLREYEVIRSLLSVPVVIESLGDLSRLEELLRSEQEQSAVHQNSPVIKLAALDFEIDRLTVLSVLPTALAVLVYLLAFYERKRHGLVAALSPVAPMLLEQPWIRKFMQRIVGWVVALSTFAAFAFNSYLVLTRAEVDGVSFLLVVVGLLSTGWLVVTTYHLDRVSS